MPTINHNLLVSTEVHEPKGSDTAVANDIYLADGAGSGQWVQQSYHFGGYLTFDAVTPAYQHSVTTSDTILDPAFTGTHAAGFTSTTTPNARVIYTGVQDSHIFCSFTISSKQASGTSRDVEYVIYLNGVAQESSRVIRNASTGDWGSVTLFWDDVLSTNDYIEFAVKGSAAITLDVASARVFFKGSAEI